MDKMTDRDDLEEIGKRRKDGFFKSLGMLFIEAKARARIERNLLYDITLLGVGFLLARCHLIFGADPLSLAFICSLPIGVWSALLGTVVGSITLGRAGIVYSVVAVIATVIRVIISSGEGDGTFFNENTLLKMCASVIGGFICSAYQVLLSGFNETSVLFSVSMVLIPPSLTFVFSGLFALRHNLSSLLFGRENIFNLSEKSEKNRFNTVYFELSCLVFLFFLTLSLGEIEFVGISAAYVFISFVTLIAAKRFGALRALAVGFASALGVSGVYSVSFALLGLVSGCLFGFGVGYGLIAGGGAAILWSVYTSGLTGLLSTLPEYAIAAILSAPIMVKISPEATVIENENSQTGARDMIGTMALVYQKRFSENLDALEMSLASVCGVMKKRAPSALSFNLEECVNIVKTAVTDFCSGCPGREYCRGENICPAFKNAHNISQKILSFSSLEACDMNLSDEFCQYPEEIAAAISKAVARARKEKFERDATLAYGGYELVSILLSEARMQDDLERNVNNALSEKLTSVLSEYGFSNSVGRVFGERRFHIIVSGEDKDGEIITSEVLRRRIEWGLGLRLGNPEYFRRDEMVLMECDVIPKYSVVCAAAFSPMDEGVRSGDTVRLFESRNGYFYSLISDGMGSGEEAGNTSQYVCDFLEKMLDFTASKDSVLHLLNLSMRQSGIECSATVDLFGIDLITGEATFVKSDAAPSYVKRDNSIFRLRSKTAPLGLLSTIDTEKLKVEVCPSDYIVMISDGISQCDEDSAWLLELLSKPYNGSVSEYAQMILSEAKEQVSYKDDMSVVVLKISDIPEGNNNTDPS